MSIPAAETAPFWPLALIAGFFFLAGAAIIAWPRPLIRGYIALLRPMRGLFGSLIDWEIRLLEGRVAPIVVRLFGAFVILAGASVIFYRTAGQ
jgi:hypothetical protein